MLLDQAFYSHKPEQVRASLLIYQLQLTKHKKNVQNAALVSILQKLSEDDLYRASAFNTISNLNFTATTLADLHFEPHFTRMADYDGI